MGEGALDGATGTSAGAGADRSSRRRADRLLLAVARDHALATTFNAASTLAGSVLVVLLPAALARAVDAVVSAHSAGGHAHGPASAPIGGALLGFALLLAALTAADLVSEYTGPFCAAAATASLRRRFLRRLLGAGPGATRQYAPGDLVGRLVGAAPDAANAPNALVGAAADVVMSAGGIAALGLIDWRLDLAFAASVPVGMLILRSFVRRSGDLASAYQRAQSEIAARLLDALAGARTIRAAGTRETEAARVLAPVPGLSATGRALWSSQRVAGSRAMLLFAVTQTAVLAVAGAGLVDGRLGVGQVLACATYAGLGLGFFSSVQAALALAQARGAAMRLAETENLPQPAYGARELPAGRGGRLVLRGVTVHGTHGHDAPVIEGIDLTIPAGTGLAVVGAAGSGKSTLAALPGRLVDPDAGTVLLDGVPLRELTHEALRGAVRYAFERPAPLGATVHETIGMGAPRHQVEAAALAAAADGFIRRLPQGYDTPLERAPLSGGETQRLGLARALTPRAGAETRVLVLDDATAALDTVTEARVSGAIDAAAAGHTRIVVAHRPSSAARADLVAWLDHGRLRALAPHHDLWPDPEYRALLGGEDGDEDADDAADADADVAATADVADMPAKDRRSATHEVTGAHHVLDRGGRSDRGGRDDG